MKLLLTILLLLTLTTAHAVIFDPVPGQYLIIICERFDGDRSAKHFNELIPASHFKIIPADSLKHAEELLETLAGSISQKEIELIAIVSIKDAYTLEKIFQTIEWTNPDTEEVRTWETYDGVKIERKGVKNETNR